MTAPEDRVVEYLVGTALLRVSDPLTITARAMAEVVKAAREWAQAGPSDEDRADTALLAALTALDTPETSEIGSEE